MQVVPRISTKKCGRGQSPVLRISKRAEPERLKRETRDRKQWPSLLAKHQSSGNSEYAHSSDQKKDFLIFL